MRRRGSQHVEAQTSFAVLSIEGAAEVYGAIPITAETAATGHPFRRGSPLTSAFLAFDPRAMVLVVSWAFLSIAGGRQMFGESLDSVSYFRYFNNLNSNPDFGASRFEIGYQAFAWVCKFVLGLDYNAFLLATIAISLGLKFTLIWRYMSMPVIGALAYVLTFYFLHEYTQFRAALGIGLVMWGVHKFVEGKWRAALVWYALALLFHYSTIIVIAIAVVARFVRSPKSIGILGVVVAAAIFVFTFFGDVLLSFALRFNPLTEVYLYDRTVDNANLLSVPNLLMMAASLYAVVVGFLVRSDYHRTFLFLGLASFVGLALFVTTVTLALRIREVLFIGFMFAFLRSPPTPRDFPLVVLTLMAGAYTTWRGLGTLFEF